MNLVLCCFTEILGVLIMFKKSAVFLYEMTRTVPFHAVSRLGDMMV